MLSHDAASYIVPLRALDRGALALAGGKAANLGELLRAGFPVPPGFCLTTAAYARAAEETGLGAILDRLASLPAADDVLAPLAADIRARLIAAPIADDLTQAVKAALRDLGAPDDPLAVRSSATAEDLPYASFAGQQDTYLNIKGTDAVLEAVRRCWASLWTERAVIYRARNGIDQRTVRLAVVIQRLVDAAVAGVLFTANPVTGRRHQTVIDGSPGLGEAVVSGAVNPDHFVVDTSTGDILERRLGDKRVVIQPAPGGGTRQVEVAARAACLTDEQLATLARLGRRVEAHFDAPQDLEFAFDRAGALWLTQARPITTLFPLPEGAPREPDDLRVYFNFNVFQGVFRPLTPMGIQALGMVISSLVSLTGVAPAAPTAGPSFLVSAAGRLFVDVTDLVRSPAGHRLLATALSQAEARSGPLLHSLREDPRLSPQRIGWRRLLPTALHFLRAVQLPYRLPAALLAPAAARRALGRRRKELGLAGQPPAGAIAAERLDLAERLLQEEPKRFAPYLIPTLVAGLASFAIAERLLGDLATPHERDAVRRALPHNPTTEMDLALWALADRVRSDAASAAMLAASSPPDLGSRYRSGDLPPVLQRGLTAFLASYGHRAVAEIDLGLPRWAEDPTPLFATLANYVTLEDAAQAPDTKFRAAARQADTTARALVDRVASKSPLRGLAVRQLLRRGRELAGVREMPKFLIVLLLARARTLIGSVGEELAVAGRLERADDVFFLTLPEVRAALQDGGADVAAVARQRRATYDHELLRRHLPRLLLSDGTEPAAAVPAVGNVLTGTPASAGEATGRARVILDPAGARLDPGEILVAPSTDPGWTPLFLTAGALVMEMGGAMSHGAVVAREYGIPAVVGVPAATERIRDGQEILVDGTAGTVAVGASGNDAQSGA